MPALTELSDHEHERLVTSLDGRAFQSRQLAHWVYRHDAANFDDCLNLPRTLREALKAWGSVYSTSIKTTARATDGPLAGS